VFKSRKFLPRKSFARTLLIICSFTCFSSFHIPHKHYTLTRVCIDAGHGGHDTGCAGGSSKEKDVALAIALKLGNYIETHFPDVKVIYTRKTDVFIGLLERAEIANNARADLFICIHCNSACYRDKKKKKDVCNEETNGVETWVMGLHKSEANLEVSKRENEVVLLEKDYTKKYDGFDPNSPEANIIFSLYQNAYLDQSLKMASLVQNEVSRKGREERGVKQAGFIVLFKTYMPSVLIETGFLTNPSEEKFLTSDKGQDALALSFFSAFKNYKSSVETGEADVPAKDKSSEIADSEAAVTSSPAPADETVETDSGSHAGETKHAAEPRYTGKKNTNGGHKQDEAVYEFAVQLLTSPVRIKPGDKKFKGQKNLVEEIDNGNYKYTSAHKSSLEDALSLQKTMQDAGFTDAFVVAYKSNKRIPLKQAKEEIKISK
jgi:N-acetylmuramoyl-L-alanine amidase